MTKNTQINNHYSGGSTNNHLPLKVLNESMNVLNEFETINNL